MRIAKHTFPFLILYHTEPFRTGSGHSSAQKAGLAGITADVRRGTRRDAVLFSVGANALHGLRPPTKTKGGRLPSF